MFIQLSTETSNIEGPVMSLNSRVEVAVVSIAIDSGSEHKQVMPSLQCTRNLE